LDHLVSAVPRAKEAAVLRMALDRLGFAYERVRSEDRLVDFWVALEALFLPDARDELKYRASLRIAYFLEKEYTRRQNTFMLAKRSYDARSAIVHGNVVTNAQ
jgi:hypothetical protein